MADEKSEKGEKKDDKKPDEKKKDEAKKGDAKKGDSVMPAGLKKFIVVLATAVVLFVVIVWGVIPLGATGICALIGAHSCPLADRLWGSNSDGDVPNSRYATNVPYYLRGPRTWIGAATGRKCNPSNPFPYPCHSSTGMCVCRQ